LIRNILRNPYALVLAVRHMAISEIHILQILQASSSS
jgi:hypothetical protein